MNKRIKWAIFLSITIIFIYFAFSQYTERSKLKEAQKIINKIEGYQVSNGFYPDSLLEVGINPSEEGPFFYQKNVDDDCILWFGVFLGGSKIYSFKNKKWE